MANNETPEEIQKWDDAATAALMSAAERQGKLREILSGMSRDEQRKVMNAADRDLSRRRK